MAAALGASSIAAVDLGAKAWVTRSLQDNVIGLGPVDLRLGYSSGVAFSLGAGAPACAVLLFGVPLPVGGLITASAAFAFLERPDPRAPPVQDSGRRSAGRIALGFVCTVFRSGADSGDMARGMWPGFDGADSVLLATGILGATVTPRAI